MQQEFLLHAHFGQDWRQKTEITSFIPTAEYFLWSFPFIGSSTLILSTAFDAAGEEDAMTLFTPLLSTWMGFAYLEDYLTYGNYVLWLFVPLILLYSLPLVIYCFVCVVNLMLFIYQKKNNMDEHPSSKSWDQARKVLSYIVRSFGKIWHGKQPTPYQLYSTFTRAKKCEKFISDCFHSKAMVDILLPVTKKKKKWEFYS